MQHKILKKKRIFQTIFTVVWNKQKNKIEISSVKDEDDHNNNK